MGSIPKWLILWTRERDQDNEWHQDQSNAFSSICAWHSLVTITHHSSLFMILVPGKTTLENLYFGPFESCLLINRGSNWWSELSKNLDWSPDSNVFSHAVFPCGLSLGAMFWWLSSLQCWSDWGGVRKYNTALFLTQWVLVFWKWQCYGGKCLVFYNTSSQWYFLVIPFFSPNLSSHGRLYFLTGGAGHCLWVAGVRLPQVQCGISFHEIEI